MNVVGSQEVWPKHKSTGVTAASGVTKTQSFFHLEAKWLFREQPSQDYGIDAHVEIVENEDVKGRLIALQIKSGDSWLQPRAGGGWDFSPQQMHVNYWQNHSLPVAVVIWHESTDTLYYREASRGTLERNSGKGWKLHFTDQDVLNETALPTLVRLSSGSEYDLRLRDLRLNLPLMERLEGGQRLILTADEYVNKMNGRGALSIYALHTDGNKEVIGNWGIFPGARPYRDVLQGLFHWAELRMDPSLSGTAYDEYETEGQDRIYPFKNSAGEVDHWSLELHQNDLARAFMILDRYAQTGFTQHNPA